MKLIWLTDLHFVPAPQTLSNHDPRVRLQLAIDDINQYHQDATYCIITGDLTDDGQPETYQQLQAMLAQLTIPVLPLAGNHDERSALLAVFTPPTTPGSEFVQYSVDTFEGRLVCLDTIIPGKSNGRICHQRFAWLKETLETADIVQSRRHPE